MPKTEVEQPIQPDDQSSGGNERRDIEVLPNRQFAELRWSSRAKETSSSVFLQGRYPPPVQALLEFTDNSFGYRNRTGKHPTIVTVITEKNRINVTDYGGLGTDAEGIKLFTAIGETEDIGIGYRGAGAKYAAWFFGEDLEIHAKKAGDPVEYSASFPGFGNPEIEYQGTFPIDPKESTWDLDKGRFEIIVRRLKNPATSLPTGAHLRRILGEVYRPLITKRETRELLDTPEERTIVDPDDKLLIKHDKVVLFLSTRKKRTRVMPLEIPLLPEYSEENIQVANTSEDEPIWFWAGEMDVKDKSAKNITPGIRFYFDGRLVNIDYCGFDKRDPRLTSLVGEVHLDNINGIKSQLSVNKSAGINTESKEWKRVVTLVRRELTPLVESIQRKPITIFEAPPRFVNTALGEARKLVDYTLKSMAQQEILISVPDLLILQGETQGQRLPKSGKPKSSRGTEVEPTRKGTDWSFQEGQTIPDLDTEAAIRRTRKSFIDGCEIGNLNNPAQVSAIIEREESGKKRKIFILNFTNPLVATARLQGELALTLLVGEELIKHVAMIYSTTVEDYRKFIEEARYQFGQFLTSTSAYRKLETEQIKKQTG